MKILLNERSLLRVSGSEAELFLQNQLTNDIMLLNTSSVQLSAYCQHQGKIIGLFWLVRLDEDFLISLPSDLLQLVISRLKMFILMSDVIIEDITMNYNQIGLINTEHENAFSINHNLSLLIETKNKKTDINTNENYQWTKACIDSFLPEVTKATSEKFVPQMLNLDEDEIGVNFSKGCYPGQEVVARLHYLGSANRRLFTFKSNQEMRVGDLLYCASSKTALARGDRYKGSGIVVSKVKYNSLFYCLATLDVDLIDEEITLNKNHGPKLLRINNE